MPAREEDTVVEYNIPRENLDIHIVLYYSICKYLRKEEEGVQVVVEKVLCTDLAAVQFFLDIIASEAVKRRFLKSAKEDFFDSWVVPSPSPSPFQYTSQTPISTH